MTNKNKLTWGTVVTVSHKLTRVERPAKDYGVWEKHWEIQETPQKKVCVIGKRNLFNGKAWFEDGVRLWHPEHCITAFLVAEVDNMKAKPFYIAYNE